MHTISIAIQKGGVGKTTTTIGLAEALTAKGFDILVADLDAQSNTTRWLLGGPLSPDERDVSDVFVQEAQVEDIIFPTDWDVDLIPASQHLTRVGAQLSDMTRLAAELQAAQKRSLPSYDVCLLDTPPYIGMLVYNALSASDSVIMPIQIEGLSISGLTTFLNAVEHIQSSVNSALNVLGVFANQVDVRRRTTTDGWRQLQDTYEDTLFENRLRQRTAVSDAATYKEPVLDRGGEHVRETFLGLADEVIERTNL